MLGLEDLNLNVSSSMISVYEKNNPSYLQSHPSVRFIQTPSNVFTLINHPDE